MLNSELKMKFTLYIFLVGLVGFSSCITKTDKIEVKVQNVYLEEVQDSNEMKEPPPPSNSIQKGNCNCDVLIDVENKNEVLVYDRPTGIVIKSLRHNFKDEDYLIAKIKKDSAGCFWVDISYSIAGNSFEGWIKKTEPIGIYARNYESQLKLHSSPDKTSKITAILNWNPELYHVTGCSEKWLYVKIKVDDKVKMGWLSPDMQCANQYTTCN